MDQKPTISKPCSCAEGSKINSRTGTCECVNGNKYNTIGCFDICDSNQISSSLRPCSCVKGAQKNSQNICECITGGSYSKQGCSNPSHICLKNENSTNDTECICVIGAKRNQLKRICECINGGEYFENGCREVVSDIICRPGLIPNPKASERGQAECICPEGEPFYDTFIGCLTRCPSGNPPPKPGQLIGEPMFCE